jgi:hypothetical protein
VLIVADVNPVEALKRALEEQQRKVDSARRALIQACDEAKRMGFSVSVSNPDTETYLGSRDSDNRHRLPFVDVTFHAGRG